MYEVWRIELLAARRRQPASSVSWPARCPITFVDSVRICCGFNPQNPNPLWVEEICLQSTPDVGSEWIGVGYVDSLCNSTSDSSVGTGVFSVSWFLIDGIGFRDCMLQFAWVRFWGILKKNCVSLGLPSVCEWLECKEEGLWKAWWAQWGDSLYIG